MRFRSLQKWDDTHTCASLVYFAQLLDEMLFDFSLDTYKASVMHTALLCNEAIQTIREVEAGNIKAPNVGHVMAELLAAFEKDPVALALSPLPFTAFVPLFKNAKTPHKELKTSLQLLALQMTPSRYRKCNERLLAEEVLVHHTLPKIRRLARSYMTTLIASGFSQRYLQETTKEFFHYGEDRIGSPQAIWDYFSLFPTESRKYSVIFKLSPVFETITEAFVPFDVKISKALPDGIDPEKHKTFGSMDVRHLFGTVLNIQAQDPIAARIEAEEQLNLCSTFVNIFHHKETPSWAPECLVKDEQDGLTRVVHRPINAMHKCADMKQAAASNRLKRLLAEFSLERGSFWKFIRSAQLHSMALQSNFEENQILNLWISLESLVPAETKSDDDSNIEHIVASIIPFLCITYFERLMNNLGKDLLRWNGRSLKRALKNVPGAKISEKLVKLIILKEFQDQCSSLQNEFRDFHLLADRVRHFQNIFSTPANAVGALQVHIARLEWQIRRIYRARNIIVHSGHTPPYTRALIEHAHDYLDTVLNHLVLLASRPKAIDSVAQGFKHVSMRFNLYMKNLSSCKEPFTLDNIDSLIFGR